MPRMLGVNSKDTAKDIAEGYLMVLKYTNHDFVERERERASNYD